jgi:acetolactate synthase-1/2/3 large subunit
MVVISGQVPTPVIGSDAFQEVDTVGITRPCVKHNFLVKDVHKLAETIRKAFFIATTGRPGPVVVDVPKDITDPNIKVPYHYPREIRMRSYHPTERGHPGQIRRAVDLMLQAKRPVVYTGGGVVLGEGSAQLTELIRLTGFPITSTLMGLGAYPMTDPQFLGMLGMHGTYEANMAMHECDVLLAIGDGGIATVLPEPADLRDRLGGEAPDVETAHKVSVISRAEGAVSAESWQAMPYDEFIHLLEAVEP